MDLLKTLTIAASGLRAQAGRMRVISENIANADSTPQSAGADPYRRKIPTFRSELDRSLDTQLVALGKRVQQLASVHVGWPPKIRASTESVPWCERRGQIRCMLAPPIPLTTDLRPVFRGFFCVAARRVSMAT